MRRSSSLPLPPAGAAPASATRQRTDWQTIRALLPYLWAYRWRVLIALACLIGAKAANVEIGRAHV